MLRSRMRRQDASPGIPARWMTASAPWQAAVMASMSVTDAWMASSPGPAVSGAMSSRRSARPGRASLGRNMDPTRPAAPVMRMTDTRQPLSIAPVPARLQTGTRSRTHLFYQPVRIVGSYSDGLGTGFFDTLANGSPAPGRSVDMTHGGGGRGDWHHTFRIRRAGTSP